VSPRKGIDPSSEESRITLEGEGFGVVALEGIACGCVVVGANGEGLPEAIGKCGKIFPNGDPLALADLLADLLTHQENWNNFFIHAQSHLAQHRQSIVGDKYANVIAQIRSDQMKVQ
jgi:glycosyltransferase involved in cell wall biosynthesis